MWTSARRPFWRRLACRVAGHEWGPWTFIRAITPTVNAEYRECVRLCGLPDAHEDRLAEHA